MFTGLGLMGGYFEPTMLTVGHASNCLDANLISPSTSSGNPRKHLKFQV